MEGNGPECVNHGLGYFRVEVQSIHHDFVKNPLHVIYKTCIKADGHGYQQKERGVNFDLTNKSSGNLVFPDHIEVGFQASESQNEGDEKTDGTDNPKTSNRNGFRIFDQFHQRFSGPIQGKHVDNMGNIVRHKTAHTNRNRNGGQHNEQGNHSEERSICQSSCTGKAVVVQKRLAGGYRNLDGYRGLFGQGVKDPFPGEIFKPFGHMANLKIKQALSVLKNVKTNKTAPWELFCLKFCENCNF